MTTLTKTALLLPFVVALCAVLAGPAHAGPWLSYDYEYSWESYAYIQGTAVAGTWTVKTSYDYRWDGDRYHYKGHGDQHFESADGTIQGHGVTNFNFHQAGGQPRNVTRTYHLSFTQQGQGLVQRTHVVQHSTYNANGELTAFVYHYDW